MSDQPFSMAWPNASGSMDLIYLFIYVCNVVMMEYARANDPAE